MVLKKWHTLEISNLTKDLHAHSVVLPEHALRGDANRLWVGGGCPLPFAQGWEGTWGGRRAMPSLSSIVQSHEALAWTLLSRLCAWEDHLFDLRICCLEAVAIGNKKTSAVLSVRGLSPYHSGVFGNVWGRFGCHISRREWVVIGIWWVQARNAAKRPTMHRTGPRKELPRPHTSIVATLRNPVLVWNMPFCAFHPWLVLKRLMWPMWGVLKFLPHGRWGRESEGWCIKVRAGRPWNDATEDKDVVRAAWQCRAGVLGHKRREPSLQLGWASWRRGCLSSVAQIWQKGVSAQLAGHIYQIELSNFFPHGWYDNRVSKTTRTK